MNKFEIVYKRDCAFFRGDIPCRPHKEYGVHCEDCEFYKQKTGVILIIKLGAIGDVIRTTPLLHRIWREYPNSAIWWLTYSPEVLPNSLENVLPFTLESLVVLQATEFSTIINLDKDLHACALAKILKADRKIGFILIDGKPAPIDNRSEHKFLTGIFDDVSKANTKSYPEEIFEICGWKFKGEEYILECNDSVGWNIQSGGKPIVGLNTGCGSRWVSRLWSEVYWEKIIRKLMENGYFPLLLGGEQEHGKNTLLADVTGALYLGHFPLRKFISLVNQCDVVVTAVTMALHIAIGLKKYVVLMNNIFNPNEFELYGRGVIVQPEKECKCFFSPTCKNPDYFCMDYLSVDSIYNAIVTKT